MTTRGVINSNFYQIVDVDSNGNPTLVKPEYIGNVANADYAANAGNANIANTANSVAVANVVGIGNIATINLDGNVSNVLLGDGTFGPGGGGGNSANANYANFAGEAFSVSGSNVVGDVANANHANIADSANLVAVANVSGIGNIATVNLDGNASNVLFGNGTFGPAGSSGNANYANFAGEAFSVNGANVVGDVANANHANIADSANLVAVGNVSGIGNIATINLDGSSSNVLYGNGSFAAISITEVANANYANYAGNAFSVDGANVVGDVSGANHANIADSANSVAGANVSGTVANANYSNFAGQVVDSTQSNITSLGTLANLSVSGATSLSSNLNMNGSWVNNIGYAVLDTDAASKLYVDTLVATGISYHQPVNAATTVTLATETGGTTAYNQPNGAGNGIGAYISTTGTFANIDGVVINGSTSTRILVKDEANATWNGVYNYTNATAITRTTDTDEYGIGSTEKIGINDYFFTQAGTVNNGTAFIVSAPAGTITFGTSNITFSIFSTSQVYTGGTGITVSGTVISANANQSQVTAVGTLTSLSVTGNIDSAFINANGVGLTNLTGGNVVGDVSGANHSNISDVANSVAVGNVVGIGNIATSNFDGNSSNALLGNGVFGPITVGSVANANFANFAGNVTVSSQPNITSLGTLTSLSVTGNVSANILVSRVATGNAPFTVSSNTQVSNLNAQFAGTVTTGSQPNITTLSNTSLQVYTSTASSTSTKYLLFTSTPNGTDSLQTNNNITANSANGAIIATRFVGNGSQLTGVTTGAAGSNTEVQFNDAGTTIGDSNFTFIKATGLLNTTSLSATGNVRADILISRVSSGTPPLSVISSTQVNNLRAGFSNIANVANSVAVANVVGIGNIATSNFDGNSSNALLGNGVFGPITAASSANANYANFAGNVVISSQPNITSTGTLVSLSVTGNIDAGYINANGVGLTSLTGANVTGTVANATFATTAGTVTTAAQPNITSLGILTSLSVSGNIDAAFINANITSTGTLTSLSVSGNATVGNIASVGLGNIANVLFTKYNETVVSGGSVSGAVIPDAAVGTIYKYTLTGNITMNFLSNAVAGTGMTVILIQGGSGSYTLTSTMKFLGGTKTLSTSVDAIDIVSIFYDGVNYYASLGKGFA